MKNNLVGLVVGIACAVIIIGSVLVPNIEDMTVTHKTFDNTEYSYYEMKPLEVDDIWTYSDSSWFYNGDELEDLPTTDLWSRSIVLTDTLVYRQNAQTRGVTYTSNSTTSAEVVSVSDVDTLLIDDTTSVSYTTGYGAVNDGEYVMKTYDDSAYVLGDTELFVAGVSDYSSAPSVFVVISGTISDGLTVSASPLSTSSAENVTVDSYSINCDAVDGYVGLYVLDSVSVTVSEDYSGTTYTKTFTYSTFVLPKEVTAELSEHMTASEVALIGIIPLLVIAVLVCAVAYSIVRIRDY